MGFAPLVYWVRARQVVRPIAVRIRTPADLFIIYIREDKKHTSGTLQSYLEEKSKEL